MLNIAMCAVHRTAAALFQGEHDFTQFANLSPANEYRHPIKRLSRCEVVDLPDGFRIEVVAASVPPIEVVCVHSERELRAML
jgi:tRNA U38,U39,U40 pseudouridine synthase TruA